MAKNQETTTKFKVDISELKKQFSEAQRQIRLANSEFKAATAGMDNWSGSADGLSAKIKQLNSVLDSEKTKLSSLEQQYAQVVNEQGETSKGAQELAIKINNQKAAVTKVESSLSGYETALNDVSDGSSNVDKESDGAAKGIKDVGDAAGKAEKESSGLASKLGNLAKTGLTAVATAATGVVTAFLGSAEATREYREDMNKLQTAYQTAGYSAETATDTYKSFFSVLGEEDRSVEAVSHLAKLTKSQKELDKWTDICAGVWGTFGDSLPIEGLTEAANETAKVGKVTGPLADALNWAGISEDEFNVKLSKCADEQERATLITNTLNSEYADAAKKYKELNGDVMDAQRAQSELTDAMAGVGAVAEPIMTSMKLLGAEMLNSLLPCVEQLGKGFTDLMNGVSGAEDTIGEALGEMLTTALAKITEMAPKVIQVGTSLILNLTEGIIQAFPQLTTAVMDILMTLITQLSGALPQLAMTVVNVVPEIINALIARIPELLDAAITFLSAMVDAIPTVLQNLIQGIESMITNLITTLTAALPRFLQGAITLFTAMVDALPVVMESLLQALPALITQIIDFLVQALPQLTNAGISLFMTLVDAIPVVIDSVVNNLPAIIEALVQGLISAIPTILAAAVKLLGAIVEAIPKIIVSLVGAIPKIVMAIIDGLFPLVGQLWTDVLQPALGKFIEWGKKTTRNGIETAKKFISGVINNIKALPGKVWTWLLNTVKKVIAWGLTMQSNAVKAAGKFISGVINNIKALPGKVWTWLLDTVKKVITWQADLTAKGKAAAKGLFDAIVDKIKGLPGEMKTVGTNLVKGLWNGIKNMTSWVKNKIKGFTDDVLNGIKDFFGIHSPSVVMEKMIGNNLVYGLAKGVKKKTNVAVSAMKDLSYDVLKQASGSLSAFNSSNADFSMPKNASGASNVVNNYTFTQTNNSPKALSRLEIYRQTRNQLAMLKGV